MFYSSTSIPQRSKSLSPTDIHSQLSNKDSSHSTPKNQFEIRKEFDNERRKIDGDRKQKIERRRETEPEGSLRPHRYSKNDTSPSRSATPSNNSYGNKDFDISKGCHYKKCDYSMSIIFNFIPENIGNENIIQHTFEMNYKKIYFLF